MKESKVFWVLVVPMIVIICTLLLTWIFLAFSYDWKPLRTKTIFDSIPEEILVSVCLVDVFLLAGTVACAFVKKWKLYRSGFMWAIIILSTIALIMSIVRAILMFI